LFSYNTNLFGSLIFRGNKIRAFEFLSKIKREIKIKEFSDFNLVILISMMNITPKVNLFFLKLGGANKKVPLPISEQKQVSFAVR
jgi:ribosomal protein S7